MTAATGTADWWWITAGGSSPAPQGRPAAHSRGTTTRRRHAWLSSWPLARVFVFIVALGGVGVLLFPSAANWFNSRSHDDAIGGYAHAIANPIPDDIAAALNAAHAYNEALDPADLVDPFAAPDEHTVGDDEYNALLDPGGDGLMGIVQIPSINVTLPIYHGVAPTTLDIGVGHMPGSALPVGGEGTHAVLTAHAGVIGRDLFTQLDQVEIGQTFTVTVGSQVLTYQVDQINVVTPDQTDSLLPTQGNDYVTLITCTPIGVNSHRLLVRGVRVPGVVEATPDQIIGSLDHGGFPSWAALGAGALIVDIGVTAPLARRVAPADRPAPAPRSRGGQGARHAKEQSRRPGGRHQATYSGRLPSRHVRPECGCRTCPAHRTSW